MPCALPTSRTSSSRLTDSRSATVWIPTRRSRSAVAGPTPGMTVTCIGRSSSCSVPGGTTTRPSGLSRSLATLAMNFEVPIPTAGGQAAGGLGHAGAQLLGEGGHGRHVEVGEPGRLEVDEGLVEATAARPAGRPRAAAPSPRRWRRGRRGTGRSGTPRAGSATGPRGSTWPSGRRTCAPRRTPWRRRRGRRRRRPRPACRAATACRAARPPRRRRPGPGGGPRRGRARPQRTPRHRPDGCAGPVPSSFRPQLTARLPLSPGNPERPGTVGAAGQRPRHDLSDQAAPPP